MVGCLVWTLTQASELSSATDARDQATAALARSHGADRFAAARLAGKRQSAISPSGVGHQIVDLARNELDLDTQTAAASRSGIRAVLSEDGDGYNAARDQLNSLVDRANAVVSRINALVGHLFEPAPGGTDRSDV